MAELLSGRLVIQCKICRKPFQSIGGKICGVCLDRIEWDLAAIGDYLNGDAGDKTVGGVETHTGVSRAVIMHLLREGRISIEDPSGGTLCCGLCGKPIETGRFCESCRNKFVDKLDSLVPPPDTDKKKPDTQRKDERRSRMHITSGIRGDGK
jgi:hypothetical protein